MPMAKEVKINIGSYFDARGVKESNDALAKIARDVAHTNDQIRQSTLRAAAAADSFAAKADKACLAMGGGYKTLAQQLEELKTTSGDAMAATAAGASDATKATLSLNDAIGASNGSFNALAKIVAKFIPGIKGMGAEGVAAIGAWGMAITSVIKLGGALYDLFAKIGNWDQLPKSIRQATNELYDLEQGAKQFAEEMEAVRNTAEKLTKNFNEQIEATNKLKQAQIEYNKALELSVAKSQAERDAIADKYALLSRGASEEASAARFDRRGQDLDDEENRIRLEIQEARKTQRQANKRHNELGKAFAEAAADAQSWTTWMKAPFTGGKASEFQKADSIWNAYVKAGNLADSQEDIIEQKQKELEEVHRKRQILAKEREAFELKSIADSKNAQTNAQQKIEEIRIKAEEDREKREDARLRKEIEDTKKALKEIEAERKRIEAEAQKTAIKNIRERIDEQKRASGDLSTVASAAASEFDRAFAWYRDPNAAKRGIGEEQDYRNDLERLHRDASRYGGKWRIDELSRLMSAGDTQGVADTLAGWRKSRSFSPQVEALVRASAAEQTKTSAEDELRKIAANTSKLDQKLDELLNMKGGE